MIPRAIAIMLACLFGLGAHAAPSPLTIGIAATATDMLPIFVANDEGFFARHELAVTITPLSVPSIGPAALMSGGMQIAMANAPILLQAAEGGLDLVAIAAASRHVRVNDYVSLVARAGAGITRAADFRGRRVGIPGLGASYDIIFRLWLRQNGVDPGDVTIVEVSLPQAEDLLKSGQMDAVAATEPVRSRIVNDGVGTRLADFVAAVDPDLLGAIWISTRAWAEAHRADIAAFRAAQQDALGFIADHPTESKQVEIAHFHFLTPSRPALTLAIAPDDLKRFADPMREMGLLGGTLDLDRLVLR